MSSILSHLDSTSHTASLNDFKILRQKYTKNIRIAHLNINSIAGFKFAKLKIFIHENLFDINMLGETKIDNTFLDSQFYIKGFRMLCKGRYGGGLLIYITRELINRLCDFYNL